MKVEPFFNKHTNALVSELKALISRELPEVVRCIQVMVFRESLPEVPFWIYLLNRFQGSSKGVKPLELLKYIGTLIDDAKYVFREDAIWDCLGNLTPRSACAIK